MATSRMFVARMFGCGVDPQTFNTELASLPIEEQLRLEGVAQRLWLTLRLRYDLPVYNNPFSSDYEEYRLTFIELPSIEIYLLVTCLDTLAGQPKRVDFTTWLKKRTITEALDISKVEQLYGQYTEEHGVGRNLKNLFQRLPAVAKDWLANNIAIWKPGQAMLTHEQDRDQLTKLLFKYFYETRRNEFTHSSRPRHTFVTDDVQFSELNEGDWWVTPVSGHEAILDRSKPKQRWNVSYRRGIDEATILRVIIHAAASQILGIELTKEFVDANVRMLSRISGLYGLIGEVNANSRYLQELSGIEDAGMEELRQFVSQVGIMELETSIAAIMIHRFLDNPLEMGMREMAQQYVNDVNYINSIVSRLNSEVFRKEGTDLIVRLEAIKDFSQQIKRDMTSTKLINWPARVEMTNLWLIVRDPCYT